MDTAIDLSIVIPVYNSEENLEKLVAAISKSLKDFSFNIILVNDCSRDNSWQVIKKIRKDYKTVTGICLRKNSGQDNAILCGLHYANGNYVVIMDDDLQHSPDDIPLLYEKILQGYDVVYANFKKKNQAWWKNLGSWFNGKLAEYFIDKPEHIYLSPFKIINGEVIKEIIKYRGSFPYIDGIIFMVTSNISQVENIEHYKRNAGSSNYDLIKSIRVFLKLATNFSIIPLRIASYLGVLTAFASFIVSFFYIADYFIFRSSPEGWITLVLVVLFIGGIILISLGVIGEYIGRLFLNDNKIGSFVIKELDRD
jgi:polyisoprenyl-phosphate glycosyltransferase